jgi:carbamoylphosphate synthase small subunit
MNDEIVIGFQNFHCRSVHLDFAVHGSNLTPCKLMMNEGIMIALQNHPFQQYLHAGAHRNKIDWSIDWLIEMIGF